MGLNINTFISFLFTFGFIVFIVGYILCFLFTQFSKSRIQISSNKIQIQKNSTFISKGYKSQFTRCVLRYINGYYRYKLFITGNIPSHHIRNFIYKYLFGVKMEKYAIVYSGAEIRAPYNLKLGKGCIIGDNAILDARHGIIIEEYVNFGSNVSLWTLQHDYNCPAFSTSDQGAPIIIKRRAWLGPNVIVLPGVTIGEGAVIGAGAVVTKDIEPFTINVGIPAKKIGNRNTNLTYEFKGNYLPFY
jgi:acetyltransferase-like isoleucine patch superfamily enzyme